MQDAYEQIYDYKRLPGLTDVHVHLRVPGGEHKEDIRSGTSAALAGGFTTILAMPNTTPPLVSLPTIQALRAAHRCSKRCVKCIYSLDTHPTMWMNLATLAAGNSGFKAVYESNIWSIAVGRISHTPPMFSCLAPE